jgi:hypothetical protein
LEKEHQLRIKELEKKNGSELTKIEELEKQIQALKRAI